MSALDRVMSEPTWVAQKPPVFGRHFEVVGPGYQLPKYPSAGLVTTVVIPAATNQNWEPTALTEVVSPQSVVLSTYTKEAQALPFVDAVYADDVAGLTIYTVYRGDPDEIDTDLYGAYQRMYQMFPHAVIDFRMVPAERTKALPQAARQLFRRA